MANQDQLNLGMQVVCLMTQNQMLKQQNAMLRDLRDRVDSVGDRLWRMERRNATGPADQAGTSKRAAQRRHLARAQSAARKRPSKQA
ncbi:MAG: hypothetical protein ACK4LR_08305 [Acidovorax temperans]|uniref:hypothetical protein n=1 Tax=Acidovorax temperans TaxID=80878 RepID=UPI00391C4989